MTTFPPFEESATPVGGDTRWQRVQDHLRTQFGKSHVNAEAMLMLIGMRELGFGPADFTKQEKQDLIHVGMSTLLVRRGYYRFSHRDQDGWPHYELVKALPEQDVFAQARFLQEMLCDYFEDTLELR